MSTMTALAITPEHRPVKLAEFRIAHGWSPSIWRRLLIHHGRSEHWILDDADLNWLWWSIESLPAWQQVPLVLTFDTGVIPWQAYDWAADQLDEFERRLPAPSGHINHVPAVAALLQAKPEAPFFGTWGTSVSENPFDPWDKDAEAPGTGLPLSELYILERHQSLLVS